jgi:hypothetical protein
MDGVVGDVLDGPVAVTATGPSTSDPLDPVRPFIRPPVLTRPG